MQKEQFISGDQSSTGRLYKTQRGRNLMAGTWSPVCQRDQENYCITCSDAVVPVRVVQVNQEEGLACVEVDTQIEEVDILLLEDVAPGDILLVHGGVAIARDEKGEQA